MLGRLGTRIKPWRPRLRYAWWGEHHVAGQKEPTVFALCGNARGPYDHQLRAAYRIVYSLGQIIEEIDASLARDPAAYASVRDWRSNFFFSAAMSHNQPDNAFELVFDSLAFHDCRSVYCDWRNGQLANIEGG